MLTHLLVIIHCGACSPLRGLADPVDFLHGSHFWWHWCRHVGHSSESMASAQTTVLPNTRSRFSICDFKTSICHICRHWPHWPALVFMKAFIQMQSLFILLIFACRDYGYLQCLMVFLNHFYNYYSKVAFEED